MDKDKIKNFAEKVISDMGAAMATGMAYVGTKTGLFRTMANHGPMTMNEVIEQSGLQARYVEEWLKGMTCAEYLVFDPHDETYELSDEHAFLLASEGSDHYVGGLFYSVPMMLGVAPRVADAFVNGGGVPFEDYGHEGVLAVDLMNRGLYEKRFAHYWLKSIPETYQLLSDSAQALDFGCGSGRVSIALASAFPNSHFTGIDVDATSIETARSTAQASGLQNNVAFVHGSTDLLATDGGYDLITICDCIHDLTRPLDVLSELRGLLRTGGVLFVIEPKAADRLEENIQPLGAMYYGMSIFHCMTQSLAAGGPGLGTCMGPAGLESLTREAGFSRFEMLDIKSQTNQFYAVRP